MARFRQSSKNFIQSSSDATAQTKLHVQIGECTFDCEGTPSAVAHQFEKFQELVNTYQIRFREKQSALGKIGQTQSSQNAPPLPALAHIFDTDSYSSLLVCRAPLPEKEPEANLALLLLLGYRDIRSLEEVPVLTLKEALKHSSYPVLRLDRVLNKYRKDRFLLKIGRGKGGKYRLTPLGVQKAYALAAELNDLLTKK